ncbi:hypothetical protein [Tepidibacter sp. Z1-5]|uniref:hypothetical protein n=1 Tax=Tepidibacter sp. Z1-5 TaxID=3134138 RepID=UPI0030C07803
MFANQFVENIVNDKYRKESVTQSILGIFIKEILEKITEKNNLQLLCEQAKFINIPTVDKNKKLKNIIVDYLFYDHENKELIMIELKDKDVNKSELEKIKIQVLDYCNMAKTPKKTILGFINNMSIRSKKEFCRNKEWFVKYSYLDKKLNHKKFYDEIINKISLIYITPKSLKQKLLNNFDENVDYKIVTFEEISKLENIKFSTKEQAKAWKDISPYLGSIDNKNNYLDKIDKPIIYEYLKHLEKIKLYPNIRIADSLLFLLLPFLNSITEEAFKICNLYINKVTNRVEVEMKNEDNRKILVKLIPNKYISERAEYRYLYHKSLGENEYDLIIYITSKEVKSYLNRYTSSNILHILDFKELSQIQINGSNKKYWDSISNFLKDFA